MKVIAQTSLLMNRLKSWSKAESRGLRDNSALIADYEIKTTRQFLS